MWRTLAIAICVAGRVAAGFASEGGPVETASDLRELKSDAPFWLTEGSAAAPLGGWAIVVAGEVAGPGPQARPKRYLRQGVIFEKRLEGYDVTNVTGLAIYEPGTLVFRDRFGKLNRRGTVEETLAALTDLHPELARLAREALGGDLATGEPELLGRGIDSDTGTLVVRLGFYPPEGSEAGRLYHHVDVVVFREIESGRIGRLHIFPVPLE